MALSVFLYITTGWRQMKTIIKSGFHFIQVVKMRQFLVKAGQNFDLLLIYFLTPHFCEQKNLCIYTVYKRWDNI